ncbi:DUF4097 family beta strand repeat protein [Clostridium sp. 'deep sea']|uniref:DUF4097 family beta strand repeat-containing protein n=1 Tax=Clostridium sp. 'deep sea' TaxID=2779445 RepID=UPI0018965971|nr:DUF4097 family beta strand repeat-containing protein [Clostridium sp. 'deep sea']QOR33888.1 DUF4097 family beta strand repeat protein [Clostridium sp. 'deep sea']
MIIIKRLALILAVVAIGCFVVSAIVLTMNGVNTGELRFLHFWSSEKTDYNDLDDVSFENAYNIIDFETLNINVVSANTEFIVEDRSDVKIMYTGKGKFSVNTNNDELNVVESFKGLNVFSTGSGSLIIYVPKDFYKDLKLNSVSGEIEFGKLKSDNLIINSVSGNIDLTNIVSKEVRIKTVSGSIEVTDFSFNSFSSTTISGNAKIYALDEWSNIKATSVSGKVSVYVTENSKPVIKYNSISGDLKSDLGTNGSDNSTQTITVNTTSGDLVVKINK